MRIMVGGAVPDFSAMEDFDASNVAFVAERLDWDLEAVVADLQAARADWVDWLERLPEEEFFRRRSFGGYDWSFDSTPLRVQWRHDAVHGKDLAAWREAEGLEPQMGSKAVLVAAVAAAREELLAAAALVAADARDLRPVCGAWTVKDLLGHIADWEWFGAKGLRQMAAGEAPGVEPIGDLDTWNAAHVEARRGQTWDAVCEDLHAARRALLEALEATGEAELAHFFPFPWGPEGTPYQWVMVYFGHDREHARDVRAAVGL